MEINILVAAADNTADDADTATDANIR